MILQRVYRRRYPVYYANNQPPAANNPPFTPIAVELNACQKEMLLLATNFLLYLCFMSAILLLLAYFDLDGMLWNCIIFPHQKLNEK